MRNCFPHAGTMVRKNRSQKTKNIGLPNEDIVIDNGDIRYNADGKHGNVYSAESKSQKYNRGQMINHVNTKHNATKAQLRTRTERVTQIEKDNGPVLQMEHDYG